MTMTRCVVVVACAVLAAVAVVTGAPLKDAEGLTTPVPSGNFAGSVSIVPYKRANKGYKCTTCSPVTAEARALFFNNAMMLNITKTTAHGCTLNKQGVYFYNLAPHTGGAYPYYYVGNAQIEGSVIPVCFFFDYTSGNFRITLDGQGTCPTSSEPPSCQNGWTAGTVTQTWSGYFVSSTLPTGNFFGNIAIVPYTKSRGTYSCTTCAPITSKATVAWNGDSFSLSVKGASSAGCSLNRQNFVATNVVEYGSAYPGYYAGNIVVEGYSIPFCFYWDSFGNVIIYLDGQGTCPETTAPASCVNGWTPGTVTQTWRGTFAPSKTMRLRLN